MSISIKDSVQKFFGFLLLIPGLLIFFIGGGMYFTGENPEQVQSGPVIVIFSLFLIIPGVILIILGKKNRKGEEVIESLVTIVKSYRRIPLSDLAAQLEIRKPAAQNLLMKALRLKLIEGHFDRTTDEFFTKEGEAKKPDASFCPSCGAPVEGVFLQGETVTCKTCGKIIQQM
ncbi:MAG: hypothetical protein GY754_06480 [bacterium]|nr:hypothetical protein [bacterium]